MIDGDDSDFGSPAAIVATFIKRSQASEASRKERQTQIALGVGCAQLRPFDEAAERAKADLGLAFGWMLTLLEDNGRIFDPRYGVFWIEKSGKHKYIRKMLFVKHVDACEQPAGPTFFHQQERTPDQPGGWRSRLSEATRRVQ